MIKFIRNKSTGILEAYKNGKKISDIITMGDEIKKDKLKVKTKEGKT